MRMCFSLAAVIAIVSMSVACGKKKKSGDVSTAIMKSSTVSAPLTSANMVTDHSLTTTTTMGSLEQSFTPDVFKVDIYSVSLCDDSSCSSLYSCSSNCGVELSKIDAFVNAINSGTSSVEEGDYNYVAVQYCPDGNRDEIQHVTLNGTFKLQGVDYATDPTSGIVAGTSGKDVSIDIKGGCASRYSLNPGVTVSAGSPVTVKLFFDASLVAYGGTAGEGGDMQTYSSGGCAGSASAYVCSPVITVVGTVDSGNPTSEHYLVANTDSSADNAPTASVLLYYNSSGAIIGGVQNDYRVSGANVTWGTRMAGGLGLVPKVVDADTVSFGEPGGSISLADWFKAFKRSTHTGTYTHSVYGGGSADGTYKATKL